MLQAVKSGDQVAVAGAAGFYFFYSVGKLYHFPGLGNRSAGVAIKGTDFYLADVGAANTKGGSLCDIGNLFYLVVHHVADIGIHKNRIHCCQDAIHLYGVAAIFEIQIAANVVYHNEILVDSKAQVGNGVMKT